MAEWAAKPSRPPRGRTAVERRSAPRRATAFTDERLDGVFAATVTPLINQDAETTGFVIVARDITVQSRLEAEREALRARLAQSEKLAALGQFVAGIAHEMNNPLQGIIGHLELFIDHSEPAQAGARHAATDLPGGGPRAEDRAQPARVQRIPAHDAAQLRVDRVIPRAIASRRAALPPRQIKCPAHDDERAGRSAAIRCCSSRHSSTS